MTRILCWVLAVIFVPTVSFAAQSILQNGETLQTIRGKVNSNFTEVYQNLPTTGERDSWNSKAEGTHTHDAADVNQDASNRMVSDDQIAVWNSSRGMPFLVTDPSPLSSEWINQCWRRQTTGQIACFNGTDIDVVSFDPTPSPAILATFPRCEGFGCITSGGVDRAGTTTIYKVNNLNDSGIGSLRECTAASGRRVCVFETSGVINLASRMIINNPYITIAGQTAPSPGIMVTGYGIYANTNDVVIQHIAIRSNDPDPVNADNLQVYGNNVVVDHISASWGKDENVSAYGNNITISNSIIAESLTSGYGGLLVGDNSQNVSVHNNFVISNHMRNPLIKGNTRSAIWNNVFYNSNSEYLAATDPENEGPYYFSMVGNLFKDGPDSTATYAAAACNVASTKAGSQVYHFGNSYTKNILDGSCSPYVVGQSPVPMDGFSIASVGGSYLTNLLGVVGSRPANRDSVDTRLVSEVIAGTGGWKAVAPSYPTYTQNSRTLTGGQVVTGTSVTWPASPDTVQPSGYTALEEALHALAAAVQ